LSGCEGAERFENEQQAVQATLDAQDDDALLARLRAGDERAFGALVDRHRPWLVRLCTRLLGHDAHAAEDAAQESLLKLHAAAVRDGRPLRVRPWLSVVARTTCIDLQRRRRPDLPGELPERAVPGEDPNAFDAVLVEAWNRLSGRHREALYLREVLGFSYKEIGAVMDLSMPATETLVFRARAALRREYERCGGSAVGYGVLGLRLARLGLGRRRPDVAVADGLSRATTLSDGGFGGLCNRLGQWMAALPGCGDQAAAKALSLAAGVVVAAAAVLPGLGPLADTPPAAAAAPMASATATSVASLTSGAGAGGPATLRAWLGNAVPADWEPHRTRPSAATTLPVAGPASATVAGGGTQPPTFTPVRDAAAAVRSGDRPTLRHPVQTDGGTGPLRSLLPARPATSDGEKPPAHPLRSLVTGAAGGPTAPLPVPPAPAPIPAVPPADAPLTVPTPTPIPLPTIGQTAGTVKGPLPLG
jgi:RNA polymerase sigma-70 factor (ECF subfamily)